MVTINVDSTLEIEREIVERLLPYTDVKDWYTEDYIKDVLERKPFYLIEISWKNTPKLLDVLVEISKEYPDVFFVIKCNENTAYGYIRYINNGKTQVSYPEVTYKGYDPKEMRTLEEERAENIW